MRTLKRILAVTLVVLCVTVMCAAGAFLLVDDATLVSFLARHLESVTGTRIDYADGASISRTTHPELTLDGLVIVDNENKYRVETRSLLVEISLTGLLAGRLDVPRLWLDETRVDLGPAVDTGEPSLAEDLQSIAELLDLPLMPKLHDVQIAGFSVQQGGEQWLLPPSRLGKVFLQVGPDRQAVELSAEVEAGREPLQLNARISDLQQVQTRQQLPFSVTARGETLDAALTGQVALAGHEPAIQAELKVQRLKPAIFAPEGLDIPGEVTATAELTGSPDQLSLEGLSAEWTDAGESSARLTGRIADITELKGIGLSLKGKLGQAEWLAPVLPESIGAIRSAGLSADISGSHAGLVLDNVSLKAKTADELDLALSGKLAMTDLMGDLQAGDLDAKLDFSAPTTRAARSLLFDQIPEFGAIQGSTDIRSTGGDPALENIVVTTRDKQGIELSLKGRIASFPLHPDRPNRGYDMDVRMQATKASVMAERMGLDLTIDGTLNLGYRLEGDTRALQINRINLTAGDGAGELLKAKGRILFREWEQEDPLKSLDLALELHSNTEILDAWSTQELPPLAYIATARLHTVSGRHRVDDFRLASRPGSSLQVLDTGHAERVTFLPEFGIEGIRLDSHVSAADVATLNAYFGLDNRIPSIGPLDMRAVVTGTNRNLLVDDMRLTAGDEAVLLVQVNGRLGHISAEKKWKLENTDLAVNGRSAGSQPLAAVLGYRLPELGPVHIQAVANDKDKTLGIENIRIRVGDAASPALQAEGAIGDIYAPGKIHLVTRLHLAGDTFAAFADTHDLSGLGDLTGRMEISDRDGALGIDTLRVETGSNDLFNLNVDGRFSDFSKPETLGFDIRLDARDMQLIGALIDRDWPDHGRVELTGELKQIDKQTRFNATLTSGKEKVDIVLDGEMNKTPPHIKGKLTASNFFIPDLFEKERKKRARERESDEPDPDNSATGKKAETDKPPVFSRTPLDREQLKAVDLDLDIDIQSFDRSQSAAESARATIRLKSGHLSVSPATLVYPKGSAEFDLQLDAQDTVDVSFRLEGQNLDPWRGLNIFEEDDKGAYKAKDAELDVQIALTTSGESQHDLAANLEGEIYAAIRNGKITQSKLRLLFVDIIGWATESEKRRYDDVNCGIADFTVRQGVVNTDAFFMDTPRISIAGKGTIDLGQEQIDYIFIPKKKSRLIAKSEPVHIRGALNDPEITAIPIKSLAAKAGTLGTMLFAPYVFAGILAGQYASGEMQEHGEDASVCLDYVEKQKAKLRGEGE